MKTTLGISIITPSYNQAAFIEKTIDSVLDQDIEDVQHIIIDGGSTDQTIDVLRKYPQLEWISEPDKGQADALNKGLKKVTGDIIGWINSDDYYEQNIFSLVLKYFRDPDVMWLVGDLTFHFNENNKFVSDHSQKITIETLLNNPDIVRQQCTFFRKDFLLRAGGWDPKYFMVMDFELWVRLAKLSAPKMIGKNLAYFRIHQCQKTTLSNIECQSKEISSILQIENVTFFSITKFKLKKRWLWLKGYIKNSLINFGVLPEKYLNQPIRTK